MSKDKYSALWVSHSSISDFLNCPRSYFLKNVYRDKKTGRKIQLASPPLTLGSVIHEVIESLSHLPVGRRFEEPLQAKFDLAWARYTGIRGGFFDVETEYQYRERGRQMIKRITDHPGILGGLTVKIEMELPYFWLSEEESIILCGQIDWLEYQKDTDSVRVIDFKTSRKEEGDDSLQLPIYVLLATNCQKRPVNGAAYWYLENSDELSLRELPAAEESQKKILKIAREINLARKFNRLSCPHNGCSYCQPLEKILAGQAQFVGVNSFGQDAFVLPPESVESREGTIL